QLLLFAKGQQLAEIAPVTIKGMCRHLALAAQVFEVGVEISCKLQASSSRWREEPGFGFVLQLEAASSVPSVVARRGPAGCERAHRRCNRGTGCRWCFCNVVGRHCRLPARHANPGDRG